MRHRPTNRRNGFDNRSNRPVLRADKLKFAEQTRPGQPLATSASQVQYQGNAVYQKVNEPIAVRSRKFDYTVDAITHSPITGYDPVFGAETVKHNAPYPVQTSAILTQEWSNIFQDDKLVRRALGRRAFEHFIWGIDLKTASTQTKAPNIPIAVSGYSSYITKMIDQLRPELFSGPLQDYLNMTFSTVADETKSKIKNASEGLKQVGPLALAAISYDIEVTALAEYVFRFDMLKAMLPKLKTRFYKMQSALTFAEDNIKRSRFTAPISTLKQGLKRQFTSSFVIGKAFQTVGASASTDGLNSMIKTIRSFYQIPNVSIEYGPTNARITTPVTNLFGQYMRDNHTAAEIEAVDFLPLDDWSIHDLMRAVSQDVATKDPKLTLTTALINKWMSGLTKLVTYFTTFETNTAPLRGLYHRLRALESGLQLGLNLNIDSLKDIDKWSDDRFIDGLFVKPISEATVDENNTYKVRIPVYGKTGTHVNSVAGGFQHYYLPSDDKTLSYGTSYRDVEIIMGNFPYKELKFEQVRGSGDLENSIKWKTDITNTTLTVTEMTTFMQDDIPFLEIKKDQTTTLLRNGDLMYMPEARQENLANSEQFRLWQQYPLPIA